MDPSLFAVMHAEDLTNLEIRYRWRRDLLSLSSGREWGADVEWARYGRDFSCVDPLMGDVRALGDAQTRDLFRQHGALGYLEQVVGILREGRHEGIRCFLHRGRDIRVAYNMHSSTLGIRNGNHAIRAGGIRRHAPGEAEREVLLDGLNLSRAMSFKNAAAQVPFGGSKITVQSEPVELDDDEAVGFLAYCLDRTRSVTGPDMGLSPGLADAMKEGGFSWNITGGPRGRLGPTGGPTAHGVFAALEEAARHRWGSPSLAGRTIVVQGVGAVGRPLVENHLAATGATILVADLDPAAVADLAAPFPDRVQAIPVGDALLAEADILMPCAAGGVFDDRVIRELRCEVIFGAANNQLKATNPAEEIRLAGLLADRGILFQVDWVHNAGGVIAGMEEYLRGEEASRERVLADTDRVCREGTRRNLEAARREGITPTEMAYRHYSEQIFG
jgi:leucine dehydrogenase